MAICIYSRGRASAEMGVNQSQNLQSVVERVHEARERGRHGGRWVDWGRVVEKRGSDAFTVAR